MNDELKQSLLHWLDKIEGAVDKGGDFVLENAPETVRQYVQFTLVENLALSVLSLVIFGVLFTFLYKNLNKITKNDLSSEEEGFHIMCSVVSAVGCIPCVMGFFSCMHTFLLAWLAPNVFVLKELKSLIG